MPQVMCACPAHIRGAPVILANSACMWEIQDEKLPSASLPSVRDDRVDDIICHPIDASLHLLRNRTSIPETVSETTRRSRSSNHTSFQGYFDTLAPYARMAERAIGLRQVPMIEL